MSEGKPYGHSAVVERREYGKADFVHMVIRRKGPLRVVERAARLIGGFKRIVSTESYTQVEWIRTFGEGSEHGTPLRRRGGQ